MDYLNRVSRKSETSLEEKIDVILGDCQELERIINRGQKLGRGSFGVVYESNYDDIVVKQSLRSIDEDPTFRNESLIMLILNTLDLPYFPKYYGYFECNDIPYVVMERINGKSIAELGNRLLPEHKQIILFQLTYALMLAQDAFQFVHYDLTRSNIIIDQREPTVQTFNINGQLFSFDDMGINIKIIDFGKSRLTYRGRELYNERDSERYYRNEPVPFSASADLCKIYSNPNMAGKNYGNFFSGCRNSGPPYFASIPPYPMLTPQDVFSSNIFDEFRM